MQYLLYFAAFLVFGIGVVHSLLGEKYILVRLFRRDNIPKLFGSADFTVRTIRFAWHLTTIAWWGFAALIVLLAHPPLELRTVGTVIGCTFIAHFLIAVVGTKGRHLSWIVFLIAGVVSFYATRS
jgi:hypothetical protein